MSFYCNGKGAICNKKVCVGCKFFNGKGGKSITNRTNFARIKNMSIDEMSGFLGKMSETIDCNSCPVTRLCQHGVDCVETYKKWLESEVEK